MTQEQNNWTNDLSVELKAFFENRDYGEDLSQFYFGLITLKPEFDQFFKMKRPRQRPGERPSYFDGIEIKSNNCVEIDCKIEFSQVSALKKDKLIEKVYDELLTESDCLTRLSKLKKFDFESYKSDLENYLIDKKYKRINTVANRVDGLANRQVITS
ncbi:hypothetical protein [Mariniradius sediminis]|uniref:Uncharacterized protein n=1 Tax=Mariniradius sediminis TaxID=2909237 RepID=A0ABS9C026_9BACT|nr:hypothetical protein [Mariniradius sediminis]MCF1753314.1 hypothetical protein [Mariniradius sediminis]